MRWCSARGRMVGAVISLQQAWALAQAWYFDRLSPDWRRPTMAETQSVFSRLGLTESFWQLASGPNT